MSVTPTAGREIIYEGADLYPKQREALFSPARVACIESSTKAGKTQGALAWLLEQAIVNGAEGRSFWWVAPVYSQAEIAYRRMKNKVPRKLYRSNEQKLRLTLVNGAIIEFRSGERPDCYDDQTEILTSEGWKFFRDLSQTEDVLTLDPESLVAEWQKPTAYIDQEYAGSMYRVSSQNIDLLTTPDHKFLLRRLGQVGGVHERLDTLDNVSVTKDVIPASAAWHGEDDGTLSASDCALMGIYLAEGCAAGCSGGMSAVANGDYTINFTQSRGNKGDNKGDVRAKIHALLTKMGYSVKEVDAGLFVRNKELWSRLWHLGDRKTKRIPTAYKNLPPGKLRILLHWMVLGDGTWRRDNQMVYYTTSQGLADDVQEIAIKMGLQATVSVKPQAEGDHLVAEGRMIRASSTLYQVSLKHYESYCLSSNQRSYITTEEYDGRIYCVSVPNHVVMVRRNGKHCWSGNSLFGDDVYAAVLDEASRMREGVWHAIRSTLTFTRGPVRIIGNVRGKKNWFYLLSRQAEAGASGMSFHRITAYEAAEAGVLDQAEVEQARLDFERLGRSDVFRELYLAEATAGSSNPFGLEAIARCTVPYPSSNKAAVAGVDLAGRGAANVTERDERADRDYTAIVMLDREGAVCHAEKFRLPHGETEERILRTVGRVSALMDTTGSGDVVVEFLQRTGKMNATGFVFTPRSKQDLMERLAIAIQNEEIHFPPGELVDELEAFQYEYTRTGVKYEASPGSHDDLVVALALAVYHLPWRRGYAPAPLGIPSVSRWTDGSGEAAAWRKYQETKKPTTISGAEQPPPMNVPALITGPSSGKWNRAG